MKIPLIFSIYISRRLTVLVVHCKGRTFIENNFFYKDNLDSIVYRIIVFMKVPC